MKKIGKIWYTDKQYIELLENRIKELKEDYDILDKFDDKNIDDYEKLEEENKKLKEHKRESSLLLKRHTRLFKKCEKLEEENKELEEKNKTFEDYNKDLNKQLDKLEEENEKLKESIVNLIKDDSDLQLRINKAIEYIGSITDVKVRYFNYRGFEKQGLHISNEELRKRVKEQKLEGQYIEIDRDDILKILKGEENENN